MPLPTPRSGENQNEFVGRCMGDDEAKRDFPDQKIRLGVCFGRFRRACGGTAPGKSVGEMFAVLEPILRSLGESDDS